MDEEKRNCWEYMQCGREPGGTNEEEMGTCPASVDDEHHGVNGGKNAGRFCWAIAGTYCKREVEGTFAEKFESCLQCPFYLEVERQEGSAFRLLPEDINGRTKEIP